ncbi:MAG: hypothetical protein CM15mP127_08090 [Gammaproteobacteria bacterium]|nr:MAG: hypothetical protein CM15mP127_08090 [Gammaproteobacteria bacterium]
MDIGGKSSINFESGAIMIYLAEKANQLLPTDPAGRAKVMEWLMFQMGGIGPMRGASQVFRYFPEKLQPAIDRYHNECRRFLRWLILNYQLMNGLLEITQLRHC